MNTNEKEFDADRRVSNSITLNQYKLWMEIEDKIKEDMALTRGIMRLEAFEDSINRVKSLVFMRLNAARDAKDKKTIATLTEIQEAMQ